MAGESSPGEITPNITTRRDGSVGPPKTYVGESMQGSLVAIPWHGTVTAGRAGSVVRQPSADDLRKLVPPGYRFVRATATAILVEKIDGPAPTMAETIARQYNQQALDAKQAAGDRSWLEMLDAPRDTAWAQSIADAVKSDSRSMNGVVTDLDNPPARLGTQNDAIAGVLKGMGDMGADAESELPFIMSYGSVVDPLTLARTGVQQARGNFMSADSMDRAMQAGQLDPGTLDGGKNTNYMSLAGGLAWLRKLSVKDPAAYNRMVVLLRNATYGSLPTDDAQLPLNGYDRRVAEAFLQAAGDLAQANDAGDDRDLMSFLQDRGKGYEDFLKQQKDEEFDPVEREYQDPATIVAAAREQARSLLGRKLTPEEEDQLTSHFRGLEDSYFDQVDGARKDGETYAAYRPDTSGQIDDYLQGDQFELERQQRSIGQYAQEFMRMMGITQ